MRLVFVQHGGTRVRDSWALENVSCIGPVEDMALAAARRLDESAGKQPCDYEFASFGPEGLTEGYDVFCCPDAEDDDSHATNEDFSTVVFVCQYVGYVRCPPGLATSH